MMGSGSWKPLECGRHFARVAACSAAPKGGSSPCSLRCAWLRSRFAPFDPSCARGNSECRSLQRMVFLSHQRIIGLRRQRPVDRPGWVSLWRDDSLPRISRRGLWLSWRRGVRRGWRCERGRWRADRRRAAAVRHRRGRRRCGHRGCRLGGCVEGGLAFDDFEGESVGALNELKGESGHGRRGAVFGGEE